MGDGPIERRVPVTPHAGSLRIGPVVKLWCTTCGWKDSFEGDTNDDASRWQRTTWAAHIASGCGPVERPVLTVVP